MTTELDINYGNMLQTDSKPSVQFSRSVVPDSLWPHGLQHASLPCPLPIPGAYSNSCPLSQWCHLTISSSAIPFSSRLQSFLASGSFPMSQLLASGDQSIGVSASASVLPMNIQGGFTLGFIGLIFLQSSQSIQLLSHVRLFVTPWTAAHQASLSVTSSWSLLRLMSIELVMPSNHLILCCPLLLPPTIFPALGSFPLSPFFTSGGQNIEVSVSASVLPMNIQDWFPLGLTGLISLQSKGLSRVFFNTAVQKHQFFGAQLSLWSNSHTHIWLLEKPWNWLVEPLLAK